MESSLTVTPTLSNASSESTQRDGSGAVAGMGSPGTVKRMTSLVSAASSASTSSSQPVEDLIDVLLNAYPKAASLPDDRGMLPLHLCLERTSSLIAPNPRILNMLLLINPSAVHSTDGYGRTPMDILIEKSKSIHTNDGNNDSSVTSGKEMIDAAVRILTRAEEMMKTFETKVNHDNTQFMHNVQQSADNERQASQDIMNRLEKELADERLKIANERLKVQDQSSLASISQQDFDEVQWELLSKQKDLSERDKELKKMKNEREELLSKNTILESRVNGCDAMVIKTEKNQQLVINAKDKEINEVKTNMGTANNMVDELKMEVKNSLKHIKKLTNQVAELESDLQNMRKTSQEEKKQVEIELKYLQQEHSVLMTSAEDLKQQKGTLEVRVDDLDKFVARTLNSHATINSNYDQVFESSAQHDSTRLKLVQADRIAIAESLEKQQRTLKATMIQHQQMLHDVMTKEDELKEAIEKDRKMGKEKISKMRREFQALRADATSNTFTTYQDSSSSHLKYHNNLHNMGMDFSASRCRESSNQENDITPTPDSNGGKKSLLSEPPIFNTYKQKLSSSTSQRRSISPEFVTSLPPTHTSKINQLEQQVELTTNQKMTDGQPHHYHQSSLSVNSVNSSPYESPAYIHPTNVNSQHRVGMSTGSIPHDSTGIETISTFTRSHHSNENTPTPAVKAMDSILRTKDSKTPLSNSQTLNISSGIMHSKQSNTNDGKNSNNRFSFKDDDSMSSMSRNPHLTFSLDSYESDLKDVKVTTTGGHLGGLSTHSYRTTDQTKLYNHGPRLSPFPGMINGMKKGENRFAEQSSILEANNFDDDASSSSLRINHGGTTYSTPNAREKLDLT